jgi:hypothetical protein
MGNGENGLSGHLVYMVIWSFGLSGLFGHLVDKRRRWGIGNGKEWSFWSSGVSGLFGLFGLSGHSVYKNRRWAKDEV